VKNCIIRGIVLVAAIAGLLTGQQPATTGPDPKEIPIPPIMDISLAAVAARPNQGKGEDVLLMAGPAAPAPAVTTPPAATAGRAGFGVPRTVESMAAGNQALAYGFAFVTFNNTDCGEDTKLRNADGSWAFRTTRFYPAYPKYDWGLLQGWTWGVSRIVDYLQTDTSIDKTKLIVTGISRTGKSVLVRRIRRPLGNGRASRQFRRRHARIRVQRRGAGRQRGFERDDAKVPQLVLTPSARILGKAGQIAVR